MSPAEPTIVAPESVFEGTVIEAVRGILDEAGRHFLLVPRFGLDFAVFLESPAGVSVRLVEVKSYSGQREGGVGFGNQRGEGPQVELLLFPDVTPSLLKPTVRWVLADATLAPGTARYACFDCATAQGATMGTVRKGKQNNLSVRKLQSAYSLWPDMLSQLTQFLLE